MHHFIDKSGKSVTILPAEERHLTFILDLMNHAILFTNSIYDVRPRNVSYIEKWWYSKQQENWPVIVAESENTMMGFGTYGPFRPWEAYRTTVEHSLYVKQNAQRQGIGEALLMELQSLALSAGYHSMIGGIDDSNTASLQMHKKQGFREAGQLHEVAFKNGNWLNLMFVQKTLGVKKGG